MCRSTEVGISLAASVFFAGTSASATTFVFDMTKTGTGSTGTSGNSMTYTARAGTESLPVKATASFRGFTCASAMTSSAPRN